MIALEATTLIILIIGLLPCIEPAYAATGPTWNISTYYQPTIASIPSISCPNTTSCMAIGRNSGSGETVLTSTDGGSSWNFGSSLPPGSTGLNAVSCVTSSICYIVGGNLSQGTILITTDFGTTWNSQSLPAGIGALNVMTCLSQSICYAGGNYYTGSYYEGQIIETTNGGTTWTTASLPNGVGDIETITCESTTTCVAGGYLNGSPIHGITIITTNSGSTWNLDSTPAGISNVTGIYCTSSLNCVLVGYNSSVSPISAVAMTSSTNGSSWNSVALPSPASSLDSLNCSTTTNCVAVGYTTNGGTENWASFSTVNLGASWTSPTTTPAGFILITSVACLGTSTCIATGFQSSFASPQAALYKTTNDNSSWSESSLPAGLSTLNSVSCASSNYCVGVGADLNGVGAATYTTNGGASYLTGSIPSGVGKLFSDSCFSVTSCVGVGYSIVTTLNSGSSWTNETFPSGITELTSVSCATSTFCVTVGYSGSIPNTSAVAYTSSNGGTSWNPLSLPTSATMLNGVSCFDSQFCVAVGNEEIYTTDGGTSWSVGNVPSLSTPLTSISCSSITSCTAGGRELLLSSDGGVTFSQATIPTADSLINSVSCITPSDCLAIGNTSTSSYSLDSSLGLDNWESDSIPSHVVTLSSLSCASSTMCLATGSANTSTMGVVILSYSPTLPSSPSSVTATAQDSAAALTWLAPTNVGGTPVTDYLINVNPNGSSTYQIDTKSLSTSFTVANLTNLTQYTFSVIAVNGIGQSLPANSNSVTPTPPPSISSLSVSSGPSSGNTPVTIAGLYLNGATSVMFGATPASSFNVLSSTSLYAVTPSEASGVVSVSVTTTFGTSNTNLTFNFNSGFPFQSLVPTRIIDTRSGSIYEGSGQTFSQGTTQNFKVAGLGGVPSNASAVVMNVTATNTTAQGGYLSIWPTGGIKPTVSSLNWSGSESIANLVTVMPGTNGDLSFYNALGSMDLIVDVSGYYGSNIQASTSGLYNATLPSRLIDTRSGSVYEGSGQHFVGNSTQNFTVAGLGSLPATGISSVVLNVTITNTSSDGGYLTAWPTGSTQPTSSILNWSKGETIANRVIVPVGTNGQISFYNYIGSADLIVDESGWFSDGSSPSATGSAFNAINPIRIVDTRTASGYQGQSSSFGTNTTFSYQIAGSAPSLPTSGVSAVVANVTATNTTQWSYLTVWPNTQTMPISSDLNWTTGGTTIANADIATLGSDGKLGVYNSAGSADVIIDISGWYST